MTRTRHAVMAIVVLSVSLCLADEPVGFDATIRAFSALRHKQALDLSKRLNISFPVGAEEFFQAATKGDWLTVSNRFDQLREQKHGMTIRELRNELWSPVLETYGIWEVWANWDRNAALLEQFYKPIFASMPKGSIYFGGTDYGRFVLTTINALKEDPPIYCITQNALADNTYTAYLRAVHGKHLWIPSNRDSASAFKRYVNEVRQGKRPRNAEIEIKDGRVQIKGALGVMEINGIVCEMIFEHNRDAHEFFVEESYVLRWMYPYLEPHGLIMKLNKEPISLSPDMIARDRAYWKKTEESLFKTPGFEDNTAARVAFAKLRCGIAGLYHARDLEKDAEEAFLQARRLSPVCPELPFRLARLHEEQDRLADAKQAITAYLAAKPKHSIEKAQEYLKRLDDRRPLSDREETTISNLIANLGHKQAAVRTEARKELREFGGRARKMLLKFVNHSDPEIRLAVQDLLKQIPEPDKSHPWP